MFDIKVLFKGEGEGPQRGVNTYELRIAGPAPCIERAQKSMATKADEQIDLVRNVAQRMGG